MFRPETKFQKCLRVINKLSAEEQKHIHPNNDSYRDSPYSIYMYIYEKNNEPIAFIDVYPNTIVYPETPKTDAFIIVAVDPEHRHQGIVKILLDKASYNLKDLGYKRLVWSCTPNNMDSRKAAVKNGFKLIKEDIDDCVYLRKI